MGKLDGKVAIVTGATEVWVKLTRSGLPDRVKSSRSPT
jgi:hypothetical protein